ncbi:hypothetical protein CBR_g37075 [Chara braunii]|uniref:Protein kinase domain-containing protein n=1 Tax=Chara braunii TaxID=69332 RepID=A0A388LM74_CHABU|nr:hypothetical protein CBR_g37075 [Chara braunii]|eukprot:GBG83361.1 hypothetical protein CBR_g37075 [Chara braunii]
MQRRFKLGDGLLTKEDLEMLRRDEFSTVGPFATAFEKMAKKVPGLAEEEQCATFLGHFKNWEASSLTKKAAPGKKLTWGAIKEGVLEGELDQVDIFQMKQARKKRKTLDTIASDGRNFKLMIEEVVAQHDAEKEARKKAMAAPQAQEKGKKVVVLEEEEEEEEEPEPQKLTKAQRKARNTTHGGQGPGKGQAPQAVVAPPLNRLVKPHQHPMGHGQVVDLPVIGMGTVHVHHGQRVDRMDHVPETTPRPGMQPETSHRAQGQGKDEDQAAREKEQDKEERTAIEREIRVQIRLKNIAELYEKVEQGEQPVILEGRKGNGSPTQDDETPLFTEVWDNFDKLLEATGRPREQHQEMGVKLVSTDLLSLKGLMKEGFAAAKTSDEKMEKRLTRVARASHEQRMDWQKEIGDLKMELERQDKEMEAMKTEVEKAWAGNEAIRQVNQTLNKAPTEVVDWTEVQRFEIRKQPAEEAFKCRKVEERANEQKDEEIPLLNKEMLQPEDALARMKSGTGGFEWRMPTVLAHKARPPAEDAMDEAALPMTQEETVGRQEVQKSVGQAMAEAEEREERETGKHNLRRKQSATRCGVCGEAAVRPEVVCTPAFSRDSSTASDDERGDAMLSTLPLGSGSTQEWAATQSCGGRRVKTLWSYTSLQRLPVERDPPLKMRRTRLRDFPKHSRRHSKLIPEVVVCRVVALPEVFPLLEENVTLLKNWYDAEMAKLLAKRQEEERLRKKHEEEERRVKEKQDRENFQKELSDVWNAKFESVCGTLCSNTTPADRDLEMLKKQIEDLKVSQRHGVLHSGASTSNPSVGNDALLARVLLEHEDMKSRLENMAGACKRVEMLEAELRQLKQSREEALQEAETWKNEALKSGNKRSRLATSPSSGLKMPPAATLAPSKERRGVGTCQLGELHNLEVDALKGMRLQELDWRWEAEQENERLKEQRRAIERENARLKEELVKRDVAKRTPVFEGGYADVAIYAPLVKEVSMKFAVDLIFEYIGGNWWKASLEDCAIITVLINTAEPDIFLSYGLHGGTRAIKIWDAKEMVVLQTFQMDEQVIRTGFCARPQGSLFITGHQSGKLQVWDYKRKECVTTLNAREGAVAGAFFHPHLPYIFSTSRDGIIKVWSDCNYQLIKTLCTVEEGVFHIQLRNDNVLVVVCKGNKLRVGTIQDVWDHQRKECMASLDVHEKQAEQAFFHPHLPYILSASSDGTIMAWSDSNYQLQYTLCSGQDGLSGGVFCRDDCMFVLSCKKTLRFITVSTKNDGPKPDFVKRVTMLESDKSLSFGETNVHSIDRLADELTAVRAKTRAMEEVLKKERATHTQQVNQLETELSNVRMERQALGERFERLQSEYETKEGIHSQRVKQLENEIGNLLVEREALKERFESSKARIQDLESRLEIEGGARERLETVRAKRKALEEGFQKERRTIARRVRELETKLSNIRLERKALGERLETFRSENERETRMDLGRVSELDSQIINLLTEREELKERMERSKVRIQELESRLEMEGGVGERSERFDGVPSVVPKVDLDPFREFSLDELKSATNDFHDECKLEHRHYGCVYMGKITPVVVKRFERGNNGTHNKHMQLTRELVDQLKSLQHPHMQKMLGVCYRGNCLVYEHMANGNVKEWISSTDGSRRGFLPWYTRLQIMAQVAQALAFLHSSKSLGGGPIIHCAIKPENILLGTSSFVTKLAEADAALIAANVKDDDDVEPGMPVPYRVESVDAQ